MTNRQPGLRKRLELEARRIFHQHAQLDTLYAEATRALAGREPGPARDALKQLRDGLVAHFEIEESTHFPALHGLSPESDERLLQLVREHAGFRAQLAKIEAALEAGPEGAAARDLEELARGLAAHEEIEEALFTAAMKGTR